MQTALQVLKEAPRATAALSQARYEVLWQAQQPQRRRSGAVMQRSLPKRPAAVQWLAVGSSKENAQPAATFPASYSSSCPSRGKEGEPDLASPAREALRSVAWLQAAVRGSTPGQKLCLRTRGALSFPPAQDVPGRAHITDSPALLSCCLSLRSS